MIKYISFSVVLLVLVFSANGSKPCNLRQYPDGYVCVCNSTYCDTLEFDLPKNEGDIVIVSSSRDGLRHEVTKATFGNTIEVKSKYQQNTILSRFTGNAKVKVFQSEKFQKIVGFGGALTGSVVHNLNKLSDELRNHIYQMYYSKEDGIGYNFMRIPIGGCDFDLGPWAYNELPTNDVHLSNFSTLDSRDVEKIRHIKILKEMSKNEDIKILGAAWSAPPWMKTNNDWTGFSALREEYYQTWADYHIRYLDLWARENVPFWGISTGNEPMNGIIGPLFVRFMSMGWTGPTQGKWVDENLGPALKNRFPDIKLLAADDQRYVLPLWIEEMERYHPESIKHVDGIAVHWYWDFLIPTLTLGSTHEKYPDKIILNTEACSGDKPWDTHGPILGSWKRAEAYADDIISDLNNWVNGWIDWNLVLDEQGGPNYVDNFVDAAVIANVTTGEEIYKQPIFYVMGHFSRFLTEDSVRIQSTSNNLNVITTAFKRPDKLFVVIMYNKASWQIRTELVSDENGKFTVTIPPKSLHTVLFK